MGQRLRPSASRTPLVAGFCATRNPTTFDPRLLLLLLRQPGGAPANAPSSSRTCCGPIRVLCEADALHCTSTRSGFDAVEEEEGEEDGTAHVPMRSMPQSSRPPTRRRVKPRVDSAAATAYSYRVPRYVLEVTSRPVRAAYAAYEARS